MTHRGWSMRGGFAVIILALFACAGDPPSPDASWGYVGGDAGGPGDRDSGQVAVQDAGQVIATDAGPGDAGSAPRFTPQIAAFAWSEIELDGRRVRRHVPARPVGWLIVWHGSGSGVSISDRVEMVDWLNRAVDRQLGVVVVESGDRSQKRFDTADFSPETNADLQFMVALERRMVADHPSLRLLPSYGLGMGSGGMFASLYAYAAVQRGDPLAALVLVAAPLAGGIVTPRHVTPTLFHLFENDTVIDNETVTRHFGILRNREVPSELVASGETLLDPQRFMRIPGVSQVMSQDIFGDLVSLQVIDRSGARIAPLDQVWARTRVHQWPPEVSPHLQAISDQLSVVWAMHAFSAAEADTALDFALGFD
jgi:hypothetical protein